MKKIITMILAGILVLTMTCSVMAAEAEETQEPEGIRNGYPEIVIDSPIALQTNWERNIQNMASKHDPAEYQGCIIFYGASNFARWSSLPKDMAEYHVLNHAFGGSTDIDLTHYANELLFPYNPSIVFFQTGSNDYVNLEGTDDERVAICIDYKKQMFSAFHEILPDAKFVIMSGLLLPGRAEYLDMTLRINEELAKLAEETDYIYYVDANDMTYDGTTLNEDLFVQDGIHLTEDGQQLWYNNYIKPALEQVITENGLDNVRK